MSKLRYGSICSGIEAATVAWEPIGWRPNFFAEVEKFPSSVLARHYPSIPNHGDITKFQEWPDAAIDLLVGGTPCQSFSVAGLRKGMADPRGNLALVYLAIAQRYRPEWLVWENVPGVLSSSGGRDFGAFLGGLVELGYGFAYRVLDAQYVRVDGFGRAVPQRRRRVFVVGNSRSWRCAAAVLFEPESLSWDSAPRRETGQGVAPTISARPTGGGGLGTDFDCDGGLVGWPADVAPTLDTYYGDKMGLEDQHVFNQRGGKFVTSAFDWYASRSQSMPIDAGLCPPLKTTMQPAIVFDTTQITSTGNYSNPQPGDPCHPLAAGAHPPAVAWSIMPQNSGKDFKARSVEVAQPIMAGGPVGGNQGGDYIQQAWAVRRLTPTECERLQGFPDGYTDVPPRNKNQTPDGPRYKALGNSMAVNAMRWIGRRIELVRTIDAEQARAA